MKFTIEVDTDRPVDVETAKRLLATLSMGGLTTQSWAAGKAVDMTIGLSKVDQIIERRTTCYGEHMQEIHFALLSYLKGLGNKLVSVDELRDSDWAKTQHERGKLRGLDFQYLLPFIVWIIQEGIAKMDREKIQLTLI